MIVKLLTEHHLELLSLKKAAEARPSLHMSNCWKSHAAAHIGLSLTSIQDSYFSIFLDKYGSTR